VVQTAQLPGAAKINFLRLPCRFSLWIPSARATVINAGFPHKFMLRANLEDCLEYGNVAALSTTRAGGTEALRDRHNRETFLQKANVRRDNSRASQ